MNAFLKSVVALRKKRREGFKMIVKQIIGGRKMLDQVCCNTKKEKQYVKYSNTTLEEAKGQR